MGLDFENMTSSKDYSNFESVVDYDTVLDNFEGPLDLLLHLINIAKINIEDIFVSKVTEQFLDYIEYMKSQPSRDVDKESEYLAMAALIVYIKSKAMVPAIDTGDDIDDRADEEKQALIEQLRQREFELIKEKTPQLKEMETVGFYFKPPSKDFSEVKVVYTDFSVTAMLDAFAKLLLKNESMQREKENIKEIPKDEYTVEQKVKFIGDALLEKEQIEFGQLFTHFSRNEIITTFQALLEMLKYQYIVVEQQQSFGTIIIKRNPDSDLKEVDIEQFDEYN